MLKLTMIYTHVLTEGVGVSSVHWMLDRPQNLASQKTKTPVEYIAKYAVTARKPRITEIRLGGLPSLVSNDE
jgi:hypothetical protein